MHLSLTFLKVPNVKDPYSFFISVVSQTSNHNGILAWLQFGFPRKVQDYKKNAALRKRCKHCSGSFLTELAKHFAG